MKQALLTIGLIFGLVTLCHAETVPVDSHWVKKGHHWKKSESVTVHDKTVDTDTDTKVENKVGGKVDLPKLIQLTDNTSVGVEAGKDFFWWQRNDGLEGTAWDQGWFGYVKVTCNWTALDLRRK